MELWTKTLDFDKLPKAINTMLKALKYQMRTHIYQETINVFLNTLTGDSAISIVFRENSFIHWMVVETRK